MQGQVCANIDVTYKARDANVQWGCEVIPTKREEMKKAILELSQTFGTNNN
jgi:hypothetical protein